MSWRTLPLERLNQLRDSERGLTTKEVAARRAKYGTNDIVESIPCYTRICCIWDDWALAILDGSLAAAIPPVFEVWNRGIHSASAVDELSITS